VDRPLPSEIYDKDYYLEIIPGYREYLEGHLPRRFLDALNHAVIQADMKILDVGCGRGELAVEAARIGCKAWGIDYSAHSIDMANQTLASHLGDEIQGEAVFLKMDATHLDFPEGFFDRAFMIDIAEHLYPEQLYAAFDELKRVVKPGGRIIIRSDPNKWLIEPIYFIAERFFNWQRHPYHVNPPSYLSMRRHVDYFGGKGKVLLERSEGLFARGLGNTEVRPWVRGIARILDQLLDNRLVSYFIQHTPLMLIFATNLWAVIDVLESARIRTEG
jgi:ubiquinone/menaquinone biosynthesis C-methylase UbiE